jgi:Protein kinase domain
MGVVYKAIDVDLDRGVALKLIAPEYMQDETAVARFKTESRLAASLEHPNVLTVHEAGEDGEVLYIVSPLVRGTDLARLLQAEGALEPLRAITLVGQVASALDAAHARGLVHRDVKPSNVLIAAGDEHRPERAYLADFGVTKALDASSPGVTRTGQFVGTLDYSAPEQLEGGDVDARTDVYALGCVLHETLTGSVPYPRPGRAAVMYAHLHAPVPRLRDARPDLPRALDDALARALAKDPADRPASAGELADDARAALEPGRRRRFAAPAGLARGVDLRTRLVQAACAAIAVAIVAWLVAGPAPIDAVWLALLAAAGISLALFAEARQRATDVGRMAAEPAEALRAVLGDLLARSGWRATGPTRVEVSRPVSPLAVVALACCAIVPAVVYLRLNRRPQWVELSAARAVGGGATVVARSQGAAARAAAREALARD